MAVSNPQGRNVRDRTAPLGQYRNPLWTNRVGHVNWRDLFLHVLNDIKIAGGTPQLPSMSPTPGGTILEAESAYSFDTSTSRDHSGYTGIGYLDFAGATPRPVQWTFNAPAAGAYVLEIRYAVGEGDYPSPLKINGEGVGDFTLWTAGSPTTWAWDRKTVTLQQGPNTIELLPQGAALIDHLNVLYAGPTAGR